MEKKLILKLEPDNEKSMKLETEEGKWVVCYEGARKVMLGILDLIGIDYQEIDKLAETTDLDNLHQLVKQGFTIRIDEIEDELHFIAFKDHASIAFGVSKEQGISSLLKNTEEWAEEFLKEENNTKTIHGKGIDSLLETIDEIFESI